MKKKLFTPTLFFRRNKRMTAVIAIILILSTAVDCFVSSLVHSILQSAEDGNVMAFMNYSLVNKSADELLLKDEVIHEIEEYEETENVVPVWVENTSFTDLMGNTSCYVFFADNSQDIKKLMDASDIQLKEGRLPQEKEYEVILNDKLIKNKGYKVGDYFGSEIDPDEWINGKYKIVGSFSSKSLIGFGGKSLAREAFLQSGMVDKPSSVVVLPKSGKLEELNEKLDGIDRSRAEAFTYNRVKNQFENIVGSMRILLSFIIFSVVFVLSISVGALIFIVYLGRNDEFGILYAIGYDKSFIKKRIMSEVSALAVIFWFIGYWVSILMLHLINFFLLNSKGQSMPLFFTDGIINTLFIPIAVFVCACVPILRRLKKFDPIAVIERLAIKSQ